MSGAAEPLRRAVLVVDDEIGIRGLLTDVLQDLGYEAIAAAGGAEAIAAARARSEIGLAIVDVNLGEEVGLDVVEELRAVHPGLPIVLSTGLQEGLAQKSMAKQLERARAHGPIELLAKPYRLDQLAALAERLFLQAT